VTDPYTRRIARSQVGSSTGAGNWTTIVQGPILSVFTLQIPRRFGFVWDLQVTRAGVPDVGSPFNLHSGLTPPRGLDPPRLVDAGSVGPFIMTPVNGVTVNLLVVNQPQFTQFSPTDNPFELPTQTLTTGLALPAGGSTTYTFTTANEEFLRAMMASAWWAGRFGFILEVATLTPDPGNPAFLNDPLPGEANEILWSPVQLLAFFTGLAGGPSGKVRAVRDSRYAMPALNTELIRDGDNPALWVRPFDWDPDDPEQTYRPRPGEGTIEDEIPDL